METRLRFLDILSGSWVHQQRRRSYFFPYPCWFESTVLCLCCPYQGSTGFRRCYINNILFFISPFLINLNSFYVKIRTFLFSEKTLEYRNTKMLEDNSNLVGKRYKICLKDVLDKHVWRDSIPTLRLPSNKKISSYS